MKFTMNSDAGAIMSTMLRRTQQAVDAVVRDHSGEPVAQVRVALARAWAASNPGAAITEPDLTNVATLISRGKRVWLTDNGVLMADD